jgi:hypothetical protein
MKNIILAAALGLATAASAQAMTTDYQLPSNVLHQAQSLLPDADFDHLTRMQVSQIASVLREPSNDSGNRDPRAAIGVILQN